MTIQRTTLHGHKATRRIKWFNPREIWEDKGVKRVNVFVIAVIEEDGFKLFAVTAQLGIDKRSRHVLPHSAVVPKGGRFEYGGRTEHTTSIYAVSAPVGKLQEAGEELVAALNKSTKENAWIPPAGVKRGALNVTPQQHIKVPE